MRVAVFGGGYAGLGVARRLERSLPPEADLVVVDESGTHVIRHLLHRAIRRPAVTEEIELPLEHLLDRATIREDSVTELDSEAGVATLADGNRLSFDLGAVCLGAEPAYHGIDGVAEHGQSLHRPADAERIRATFLDVLESSGRVVIGGGGLTGIQVAGELAALADEHENRDRVDIALLEATSAVPPGFDDPVQAAVVDSLADAGVTVRTDTPITGADADSVTTADGERVDYAQFVWAGGIGGHRAIGADRPTVRSTLRLAEDVFAAGDAAAVIDEEGRSVPATAQAAIRQAPVVAENLTRLLRHRRAGASDFEPRLDRYRYDEHGWAISVGDDAVATVGPGVLTGQSAVGVKKAVGAGYLSRIGAVSDAVEHVLDALDRDGRCAERE